MDRQPDLCRIGRELRNEAAIAVDVEADSLFHYHPKVCLIQIATPSKNILIDPLAIESLSELIPVFSDPGICKVFHGADYDIRSLARDFGMEVNGLFDTQVAAAFLGLKETGLAGVVKERLGVTLDKKYQKKDWSRRPLPQPMLEYAVKDVLYLLPLADTLRAQLEAGNRLFCVEEECRRLSRVRAVEGNPHPLFLKFKGAGKLDARSLTVLEAILKFRDEKARDMDRPPFKVFGNAQIQKMVREKPRSVNELLTRGCLSPGQTRVFGHALCRKINQAMHLPESVLLTYPRKTGKRLGSKASDRVKALRKWREVQAREMGLDPALICSNAQIRVLAVLNPETSDDLKTVPGIRDWQRALFARDICDVLHSV